MSTDKSKLYLLLISVHGLIRGQDLELGRDADTGGQTLYVVELARALGERDDVERVDLVTRRVVDPAVSDCAKATRCASYVFAGLCWANDNGAPLGGVGFSRSIGWDNGANGAMLG